MRHIDSDLPVCHCSANSAIRENRFQPALLTEQWHAHPLSQITTTLHQKTIRIH